MAMMSFSETRRPCPQPRPLLGHARPITPTARARPNRASRTERSTTPSPASLGRPSRTERSWRLLLDGIIGLTRLMVALPQSWGAQRSVAILPQAMQFLVRCSCQRRARCAGSKNEAGSKTRQSTRRRLPQQRQRRCRIKKRRPRSQARATASTKRRQQRQHRRLRKRPPL